MNHGARARRSLEGRAKTVTTEHVEVALQAVAYNIVNNTERPADRTIAGLSLCVARLVLAEASAQIGRPSRWAHESAWQPAGGTA